MENEGMMEEEEFWRKLWSSGTPVNVNFAIWNAVKESLPTAQVLYELGFTDNDLCKRCNEKAVETVEHVFLECEHSKRIWRASSLGFNFDIGSPMAFEDWVMDWYNKAPDNEAIVETNCLLWQIWKARSIRFRGGKMREPMWVVKEAKKMKMDPRLKFKKYPGGILPSFLTDVSDTI